MTDLSFWGLSQAHILLSLGGGYLLGSIPFGLVFCYLAGYGDIRNIGSGNIGATNVLRTGNKILAFLTLVFDISKGAIAVLLCTHFMNKDAAMLAGAGSILGHCFPVWLKFKGGKGVATTLGTIAALNLNLGLIAGATWLLSAFIFRISSLSALIALAFSTVASYYLSGLELALTVGLITLLVYIRHKDNIRRLFNGTEPKIGGKKKGKNSSKSSDTTSTTSSSDTNTTTVAAASSCGASSSSDSGSCDSSAD